jgi:hypothetical protein
MSRIDPSPMARCVVAMPFLTALVMAGVTWQGSRAAASESPPEPPVAVAAPLDGRTFSARIVRAGSGEDGPLEDELLFSDGMFSSAICKTYNFAEAPYWVRREGDRIHFLAELTNPTDGTMLWKGTIEGGTLDATMQWTKKRWYWTIDTEHDIRGELEGSTPPATN